MPLSCDGVRRKGERDGGALSNDGAVEWRERIALRRQDDAVVDALVGGRTLDDAHAMTLPVIALTVLWFSIAVELE
jgi:hypothetical protein